MKYGLDEKVNRAIFRRLWIAAAIALFAAISPLCIGQNKTKNDWHAKYTPALSVTARTRISDSLSNILKTGKLTYEQKSSLLMNLSDISNDETLKFKYAEQLLEIAESKHDTDNQVEALIILCGNNQPELEKYLKIAMALPKSPAVKELIQLYRYTLQINSNAAKHEDSRNKIIRELIKKYSLNKYDDVYQKAGDLLIMSQLISFSSQGDLYGSYLSDAQRIVRELPKGGYNLLAFKVYTLNAAFLAKRNMQKEALASDMQLLKMYGDMEKLYKKQGRVFISMDQFRYLSYRRLLAYDNILSGTELDSAMAIVKRMAAKDIVIYNDLYAGSSLAFARYYMSKKEYAKAIPYLNAALDSNADSVQWRIYETLKMRVEAGSAIKDTTMHKYLLQYVKYLDNERQVELEEKQKELDVIYNINDIKQKISSRFLMIVLISIVLILVGLMITIWLLMRSRRMKSSLKETQIKLIDDKLKIARSVEELKKAEEQAIKASRLKTMFLQNMSHEIRTPLNSIIGFSQLIAESRKDLSPADASTYLDMISNNSQLLLTLISDVLDIARMEAGEIKYNFTDFSVNDLCVESVQSVIKNVRQGVKLSFCRHEHGLVVYSDLQRVQQVIFNLLTNACKFTLKGSIVLDYNLDKMGKKVVFSVTDTGVGIPADKRETVFKRFEKLDKFTQGTGLGLHICKMISRGLHGDIMLDNNYSGGSRFLFEIPLRYE